MPHLVSSNKCHFVLLALSLSVTIGGICGAQPAYSKCFEILSRYYIYSDTDKAIEVVCSVVEMQSKLATFQQKCGETEQSIQTLRLALNVWNSLTSTEQKYAEQVDLYQSTGSDIDTITTDATVEEKLASKVTAIKLATALAYRNHLEDAFRYHLELADAYGEVGQYDDAVQAARDGIDLYKGSSNQISFQDGLINGFSNLVTLLAKANRTRDIDTLFKCALHKVKHIFGENSPAMADQLAHYTQFLLAQKRDSDALRVLNRLLKINPRYIEICNQGRGSISSARERLVWSVYNLTRDDRCTLALTILERLLASQQKVLGENDSRCAETLIEIAKVKSEMNHNSEALVTVRQAYNIRKLYESAAENKRYLQDKITPFLSGAERTAEFELYLKSLTDPDLRLACSTPSSQDVEMQKLSLNDRVKQLTAQLSREKSDIRYGYRVAITLSQLIDLYVEHNEWNAVNDAALEFVDLQEHVEDDLARHARGCFVGGSRLSKYLIGANAMIELRERRERINGCNEPWIGCLA